MASFPDHIGQVRNNLTFLEKINSTCKSHWDWQVTACYYVSVHAVNAHTAHSANMHYRSHKQVEEAINPYNQLSPAQVDEVTWLAYKSLRNLSRRSRYLINDIEDDKSDAARFTHDKHFRKAVLKLDLLISYFKDKYGIILPEISLECVDFRHSDNFSNFKKI